MGGNVVEWVQDQYNFGYNGAPLDGSAFTTNTTSSNRVLRGGGWFGLADSLRVESRPHSSPTFLSNSYGGRLSRSMIP